MPYPDRLQLALAFDPRRLESDLESLAADAWVRHFVPRNYEGDWSIIPLRAPAGANHPIMTIYSDPNCRSFEDTPLLLACPYFQEVLRAFECPLHAVRLMRLGPGSVIKEHRDHDLSFEDGAVRLHIPITTNDKVDFRLNGTPVRLLPGTTWYLRLSDPHSVVNAGATERVHLVLDAVANDWLDRIFQRSADAAQA